MLKNRLYFLYNKIVSANIQNVPSAANGAGDVEIPEFLTPFQEMFNLEEVDPVIARDKQIEDILSILATDSNGNVMLLGFPGTGKTVLAKYIAKEFMEKQMDPAFITGEANSTIEIMYMDAGDLSATNGSAAEKIKQLKAYLKKKPNTLIFVDEAHCLGKTEVGDSSPIIELMKPMLNDPNSHFIFATTVEEHKKYLSIIPAMDRRWTIVPIPEATPSLTKLILRQHRKTMLARSKYAALPVTLEVPDAMVNLIVELAVRYIDAQRSGYNPSRSIKLLEQSVSRLTTKSNMLNVSFRMTCNNLLRIFNEYLRALEQKDERSAKDCLDYLSENIKKFLKDKKTAEQEGALVLTEDIVYEALAVLTGLPSKDFEALDRKLLDSLVDELKKEVVGQDVVMETLSTRIKRAKLGLSDPKKPLFVGLFAGKTGTGKTQTAKCLARVLYKNADNLVEINGGEYAEKQNLTKLTGATATWIGYGDPCVFDRIKAKGGQCVFLIDEFEKMHPDAQKVLLGILDTATAETGKGEVIDFRETAVILTSNLGSERLIYTGMGEIDEGFDELLGFRRETVSVIEALAIRFARDSEILQQETRFDEAAKVSEKEALVRRFLTEHTDDLQRGVFPEGDKTGLAQLDTLLDARSRGDKEVFAAVNLSGSERYDKLLSSHRRLVLEELKEKRELFAVGIGSPGEGDEKAPSLKALDTYLSSSKENISKGDYHLDTLSAVSELAEIRGWLNDRAESDNALAERRRIVEERAAELKRIEKENAKIIREAYQVAGYRPEFLARIMVGGGIFAFNSISMEMAQAIIRITARKFIEEQKKMKNCDVEIADEVYDLLIKKVPDLEDRGGRGIEEIFGNEVSDRLVKAFESSSKSPSNTRVVVSVDNEAIEVDIVELGDPDLSLLPDQEGEAGGLVKHFHDQAVALNQVYASYDVSMEEIRRLLNGEKIVDRGTSLDFEPSEIAQGGKLITAVEKTTVNFRKTAASIGLKLFSQHLGDIGVTDDFATAAQDVAKGLVSMAAKTLFDYSLRTDFGKKQESFDSLARRGNGDEVFINRVITAKKATNSLCEWDLLSGDKVRFKISIPCKLTDRELKLMKLYSEKAVSNSAAARRIVEAANAEGVVVNESLLIGLGKLIDIAGPEARIGFYIEEGNISYWMEAPFVYPQVALPSSSSPVGAPIELNTEIFDITRWNNDGGYTKNTDYMREFLSSHVAGWEVQPASFLETDPIVGSVRKALSAYVAEQKGVAEDSGDVTNDDYATYIGDGFKLIFPQGSPLLQNVSVNVLLRDALRASDMSFMSEYRTAEMMIAQGGIRNNISELASKLRIDKQQLDLSTVTDTFATLQRRNAIRYAGGMDGVKLNGIKPKIAADPYLCRLLEREDSTILASSEEGNRVRFEVKVTGGYTANFVFNTNEGVSVSQAEEEALNNRVSDFIREFDVPISNVVPERLGFTEAAQLMRDINSSPKQDVFISRLIKHVAISGGPLNLLQNAISNRMTGSIGSGLSDPTAQLDFIGTARSAREFWLKLYQNFEAVTEMEMPNDLDTMVSILEDISSRGDSGLVFVMYDFLHNMSQPSTDAGRNFLRDIRTSTRANYRIKQKAERARTNGYHLMALMDVNCSAFTSQDQFGFWETVFENLFKEIDLNLLKGISEKVLNDDSFRDTIFPSVFEIVVSAKKAYEGNYDQAYQAFDFISQLAQTYRDNNELKPKMINWLKTEFDSLVKLANTPERVGQLKAALESLMEDQIAKENPGPFIAMALLLERETQGKTDALKKVIAKRAPSMKKFTEGSNQLLGYQSGSGGPQGAVDTLALLADNRPVLESVCALLEGAINRNDDKFTLVMNGSTGSSSDVTLGALLNNDSFFQRAGGAVIMLAVRETGSGRILNVSVTGKRAGSPKVFEAELQ